MASRNTDAAGKHNFVEIFYHPDRLSSSRVLRGSDTNYVVSLKISQQSPVVLVCVLRARREHCLRERRRQATSGRATSHQDLSATDADHPVWRQGYFFLFHATKNYSLVKKKILKTITRNVAGFGSSTSSLWGSQVDRILEFKKLFAHVLNKNFVQGGSQLRNSYFM